MDHRTRELAARFEHEWNAARDASRRSDLDMAFAHLERALDESGFLRNIEKRPSMVRNIRSLFDRAELTEQEIQTLHGIVKELSTLREERRRKRGKGKGGEG